MLLSSADSNYIEFRNNENIVNQLRISDDIKTELEDSTFALLYRIESQFRKIHDKQKMDMLNDKQKEYAKISKSIAYDMKSRLLKGDLDNFGDLLDKAWQTKKEFSNEISSPYLDEIYDYALKNGALGGKLLGAGGGGYFIFYVPTFKKISLSQALNNKKLTTEYFTFDDVGLRHWITKKKQ